MEKDEYCFPDGYGLPDEDGNSLTVGRDFVIDSDDREILPPVQPDQFTDA